MKGSQTVGIGMADMHPRRLALAFERVPQRKPVHDRRQHAHIVAAHPVHAVRGAGKAAIDIAAADHEADLGAEIGGLGDVRGDAVRARRRRCRSRCFPIRASPESFTRTRR